MSPEMARPRGSQGIETRERILDVAQELFTRHGYDKTSLRDIAERLEITKAALYYYFERKEDILLELHRRLQVLGSGLLDALEAAPDGPARYAIWPRLADEMIDFMVDNRELILLHDRNRNAFAEHRRADRGGGSGHRGALRADHRLAGDPAARARPDGRRGRHDHRGVRRERGRVRGRGPGADRRRWCARRSGTCCATDGPSAPASPTRHPTASAQTLHRIL